MEMTIDIKVHSRLVESITVDLPIEKKNKNEYLVNGIYTIKHDKENGHRELARKALEAIKRAI